MLGCNAWGQALFSIVTQLAPFLLLDNDLTKKQHDLVKTNILNF